MILQVQSPTVRCSLFTNITSGWSLVSKQSTLKPTMTSKRSECLGFTFSFPPFARFYSKYLFVKQHRLDWCYTLREGPMTVLKTNTWYFFHNSLFHHREMVSDQSDVTHKMLARLKKIELLDKKSVRNVTNKLIAPIIDCWYLFVRTSPKKTQYSVDFWQIHAWINKTFENWKQVCNNVGAQPG